MTKTATYSLWLEPSGDIAFRLEERIKKLSDKYGTPIFPPHVTLLGGLKYKEAELTTLANTLASSLDPFELELTKAGYEDNFYRSLYIHVKATSHLKEIHKMACQLFEMNYEDDFVPHLSLMYSELPQDQKERILNVLGREFHIHFPVKSIVIMQTDGKPEQWKKVHTSVFKHH
ncbi:MAG TPA: 2'-5' RNA ligase family protein [Balneolaceae bacterium]|nr:2'-5' RNA ligase family protein [Balneolaceae bacterium]